MSWHRGEMLAFDLETTGVDPETARIVTASIVHILPGVPPSFETWMANPGVPIPEAAAAVHGITTELSVREGWPADVVTAEISAVLHQHWSPGVPLIAYNAAYDLTLFDRELRRRNHHPFTLTGPVIDPLVLDRAVDRYRRGKRTLDAACTHYGVDLTDAHSSNGDAIAAARVAWAIAERYPNQVGDLPLDELHKAQQEWHADWAEEFEKYLARKGKPEPISRDWPIRPYAGGAA